MALLLAKAKMGPKRLKRATAVRFWCSWYPTQYFWIRPVILDRFQGPGRSFSDQKLGLKSKSGFSGHPRYLRPKLRTSDQNALKQTGSEGPQNLSMGFWHVKHQFYLPAQKCSNLTHPNVHWPPDIPNWLLNGSLLYCQNFPSIAGVRMGHCRTTY